MSAVVVDTHAVGWYLQASPDLSVAAKAAIGGAIAARDAVYVSTVTLAEILYLVEKGRVAPGVLQQVEHVFVEPKL